MSAHRARPRAAPGAGPRAVKLDELRRGRVHPNPDDEDRSSSGICCVGSNGLRPDVTSEARRCLPLAARVATRFSANSCVGFIARRQRDVRHGREKTPTCTEMGPFRSISSDHSDLLTTWVEEASDSESRDAAYGRRPDASASPGWRPRFFEKTQALAIQTSKKRLGPEVTEMKCAPPLRPPAVDKSVADSGVASNGHL
jgi:hypothetical protein